MYLSFELPGSCIILTGDHTVPNIMPRLDPSPTLTGYSEAAISSYDSIGTVDKVKSFFMNYQHKHGGQP